ncbi:hypothetical protein [Clostridium hydrogenum]|uniref:hypothetical protein n=1 Tax=Clostridium hydrogenum TaxID=2855764 RepID=UPI001F3514D7|nr:hypothetical protein [Clostridium hydrogenum]
MIDKIVYSLDNNDIREYRLNLLNKVKDEFNEKISDFNLKKMKNVNKYFSLTSKKAYIVLEGEEIYIKYLKIPKVSDEKLYALINSELSYLYSNEKRILFNYKKLRELDKFVEVIVFYLREDNLNFINKLVETQNLKAVRIIQICFLKYYSKCIKEHNYLICFNYNSNLYILFIKNKNIFANGIYSNKNNNIYNAKEYIEKFLISNNINSKNVEKVYVAGKLTEEFNIIDLLKKISKVEFLNEIDRNKVLKLIV